MKEKSRVKESIGTRERQYAGLDRHFRGPDGFGWFSEDPNLIAPEMLQRARFKIGTVDGLSNRKIFAAGQEHRLAPGSFSINMDYGRPGLVGGAFTFSHPEDVRELLTRAGVKQPGELIGREMIQYWVSKDQEPKAGDRTVGVDLPEFSIPLSELIKRDQRR